MEELNTPLKVSFAQNREDIFLESFFKDIDQGFYVDIGANDPVEDSVTKLFYDKGWEGINVEPIKVYYQKLLKQRPRDINLNIGISNENGSMLFREYKEYHGLSTMAIEMVDLYEENADDNNYKDHVDHEVTVRTLESVFNEYKISHIHFLKVDVEGFEYEVLKGNNWSKYRPELICIESNHLVNDWRPLLDKANYNLVFNDGLNDYYLAKESSERAKKFSYTESVLPAQILNFITANAINSFITQTKAERNTLISRNLELISYNEDLEQKLVPALDELQALQGLKNLGKAFLMKLNQKIENKIYPEDDREKVHLIKAKSVPVVENSKGQLALIDRYDKEYLPQIKLEADYLKNTTLKLYRIVARVTIYWIKFFVRGLRKTKRLLKGER